MWEVDSCSAVQSLSVSTGLSMIWSVVSSVDSTVCVAGEASGVHVILCHHTACPWLASTAQTPDIWHDAT